ncbi:MAG: ECF-type sigma factor [Pirellulaceae bacterium]
MSKISDILLAIDSGDQRAAESLLPIVYGELRKLASARLSKELNAHSLQPTALVHEAYLRLVDNDGSRKFDSQGHFFAAAAEAMRRILVDRARRKGRPKHGGDRLQVPVDEQAHPVEEDSSGVLDIHEVLEKFERLDKQKAQLVKLRYFAGMTLLEAANALNISRATAVRHWAFSKAWMAAELSDRGD